jgi:hypothetical protein
MSLVWGAILSEPTTLTKKKQELWVKMNVKGRPELQYSQGPLLATEPLWPVWIEMCCKGLDVVYIYNPKLRRQRTGRWWFEVNPGQIVHDILSQKNPTQKRLGEWLKWKNSCLASMRPWVQTPVLQKTEREGERRCYKGKYTPDFHTKKKNASLVTFMLIFWTQFTFFNVGTRKF